jgi:parvulin-like peptidyl-prolyl isomerase
MRNVLRSRTAGSVPLLLWGSLAAVLGCQRKQDAPDHQVVARIGDRSLRLGDVEAEIAHRAPGFRGQRYDGKAAREGLLDSMVRFEVLALEAEKRGFAQHPDVVRAARREMVAVMIRKEVDEKMSPRDVPDQAVEQRYRERLADFAVPAHVRVSQVVLADAAAAAKVAALARAARRPDREQDAAGFRALVDRHSIDDASRSRGGDLGTLTARSSGHHPGLLQAALALQQPGAVSDVVRTPAGFHVLKLVQRTEAAARPLAEVRGQLVQDILGARRGQKLDQIVEQARAGTRVEVFKQRLDRLAVPAAQAPKRPPAAAP